LWSALLSGEAACSARRTVPASTSVRRSRSPSRCREQGSARPLRLAAPKRTSETHLSGMRSIPTLWFLAACDSYMLAKEMGGIAPGLGGQEVVGVVPSDFFRPRRRALVSRRIAWWHEVIASTGEKEDRCGRSLHPRQRFDRTHGGQPSLSAGWAEREERAGQVLGSAEVFDEAAVSADGVGQSSFASCGNLPRTRGCRATRRVVGWWSTERGALLGRSHSCGSYAEAARPGGKLVGVVDEGATGSVFSFWWVASD
jgi:hypothetical protein